uniref:Uncharacterized protein n=1 Tax=Leersia perrieri TaxID=77586 RepID=A0A0D9XE36_9ORYZ
MELLDMVPADAIALRLYSLPAAATAAASLWAWLVAALAAAFGLWRFRAAGVRSALVHGDGDDKQKTKPQPPSSAPPAAVDEARAVATTMPTSPMSEPNSPSKVRFTAYYGGAGDDDIDGGVRRCDETEEDGNGETAPMRRTTSSGRRWTTASTSPAAKSLMATPWEEREMAVRRRGDLGWYRHLDMAALDGSVVRLWDCELTAAAAASSPRRRGRRALSELHLLF